MIRTFYDFDTKLRNLETEDYSGTKVKHNFKRFTSLSALPFDFMKIQPLVIDNDLIQHYKDKITKRLMSRFAVPTLQRSPMGSLVNVEEALEGIPECYRHLRPAKSVLKLGLNVSAQANVTDDIAAMRCAAIMAIDGLAKSRGQGVQFDVCYGAYGDFTQAWTKQGHSRITIQTMTPELIKRVLNLNFRDEMIYHLQYDGLAGGYQIWYLEKTCKKLFNGQHEFDFILDRLETPDKDQEYARILEQIAHLTTV